MKVIVYAFIIAISFGSCKKQDTSTASNPAISYSLEVKSIFVNNCTSSGCHDGINMPSLGEYTTARDAAAQIRTSVGKGRMPLNRTMSEKEKAAILCWIDNGAKFN